MTTGSSMLVGAEQLLQHKVTPAVASELMGLLGVSISEEFLADLRLYSDLLPMGAYLHPYTQEQRLLHFLWDAFDKTPYSLAVDFAIPFRRLLAGRLFTLTGQNFICESGVTFNYGHRISVGDKVFFNRGVCIDAKGGVIFGHGSCLAEGVRIFTHNHGEAIHHERTYAAVIIKDYVKVCSGATILPGVTVGEQAIVAAGALVTKDIPPNSVVAGVPAQVMRERNTEGRRGSELEHTWLHAGEFQQAAGYFAGMNLPLEAQPIEPGARGVKKAVSA